MRIYQHLLQVSKNISVSLREDSHFEIQASLGCSHWVLSLQSVRNRNVQVTLLLLVRLARQESRDGLLAFHSEDFSQVEDRLLPVGVFAVGTGGEVDWFMTGTELDIEPRYHSMDEVRTLAKQGEGSLEGKLLFGHRVQINGEDKRWIGHAGFHLDSIDKRLGQGGVLQRRKVESVHVIPNYLSGQPLISYSEEFKRTSNLLVFVLSIFDACHVDFGIVRKDQATFHQVPIASINDGVEHAFV